MNIELHDLSENYFEKIVIGISKYWFGEGAHGYAKGKDEGIDVFFEGKAIRYPSENSPLDGKIVCQAKHTSGYSSSFSDNDFFSTDSKTCTISLEIPKIKKLYANKKLDYYFIFSNRKLTTLADTNIKKRISKEVGIDENRIFIIDEETIKDVVRKNSQIFTSLNINPFDLPFDIKPDELEEVIENIARENNVFDNLNIQDIPVDRTNLEDKNRLNNLSDDYSKEILKKSSDFSKIQAILSNPNNKEINTKYLNIVDDFNSKIIANKNDSNGFDSVLDKIISMLFDRSKTLKKYRKLTRIVVYHMYWYCDIGKRNDTTN